MSSVSSVVKRFNLNSKKEYQNTVIHDFFDTIDTSEKAYLLGFFIADGCICSNTHRSNGRFSISQSLDDQEVVKAFKYYLNIPNQIQYVDNQIGVEHRKLQNRIRWTSVHMADTFKEIYKITPNKTLNIDFEFPIHLIPENLQGHFVRGFIDGDGYIGDNGFKNNISISIIGTSIKFITLIGDLVSKNSGMSYKIYEKTGKTCKYYNLRWSCDRINKLNKITKLYHYLYNNATIFLSRKRFNIEYYIEYRAKLLGNTNNQCNA